MPSFDVVSVGSLGFGGFIWWWLEGFILGLPVSFFLFLFLLLRSATRSSATRGFLCFLRDASEVCVPSRLFFCDVRFV